MLKQKPTDKTTLCFHWLRLGLTWDQFDLGRCSFLFLLGPLPWGNGGLALEWPGSSLSYGLVRATCGITDGFKYRPGEKQKSNNSVKVLSICLNCDRIKSYAKR